MVTIDSARLYVHPMPMQRWCQRKPSRSPESGVTGIFSRAASYGIFKKTRYQITFSQHPLKGSLSPFTSYSRESMVKLQINITLWILEVRSRDFTQTRVPMSTFDTGACALVKTTLGSAAKVLRLSQSAASVLRSSDFYENSSVIDSTRSLSIHYSDLLIIMFAAPNKYS